MQIKSVKSKKKQVCNVHSAHHVLINSTFEYLSMDLYFFLFVNEYLTTRNASYFHSCFSGNLTYERQVSYYARQQVCMQTKCLCYVSWILIGIKISTFYIFRILRNLTADILGKLVVAFISWKNLVLCQGPGNGWPCSLHAKGFLSRGTIQGCSFIPQFRT